MGPFACRSRFPKTLRGKAAMISLIRVCEKSGAKSPVTQHEKVVLLAFRRTGLRLLDDEDEDPIGHPRPPQSEVGWDSLRGDPLSKRLLPHWHRSSYSSFLTKRAKSKLT